MAILTNESSVKPASSPSELITKEEENNHLSQYYHVVYSIIVRKVSLVTVTHPQFHMLLKKVLLWQVSVATDPLIFVIATRIRSF